MNVINKLIIMQIFDKFKKITIPIKTWKGAGLILLNSNYSILLVRDTKSKKFGFPKGHYETYDKTPYETALRELNEETGLLEKDFKLFSDYPIMSKNKYYFWIGLLNETIENVERFHVTKEEPTISLVKYYEIEKIKNLNINISLKKFIKIYETFAKCSAAGSLQHGHI
jgi:8-oxo-dGTP pyrophosphatase MutT (NUDIX family)